MADEPATQAFATEEASQTAVHANVWGQAFFNGNLPGHENIDFVDDEITFGRKATCHVKLTHMGTSGLHCVLKRMGGEGSSILMLRDMSSNGTFVNGVRIGQGQQIEIKNGQEIVLIRTGTERLSYLIRCYDQDKEHAVESKDPNGPYQKYVIGQALGSGAYATVKKCVLKTTGAVYAIKVVDKHKFALNKGEQDGAPADPAKLSANLNAEANILRSLDHSSVVRVFDVFETKRFFYIVLELLPGGDLLDHLITRNSGLNEAEARYAFAQLLDAADYLHSRNIVHRDIKPENVLIKSVRPFSGAAGEPAGAVGNALEVKLADFGLSRVVGEGSFMQTICGTPQYLAPEVLKMAPFMLTKGVQPSTQGYSKACDIWSLGVMLYVLIAAIQPFDESNIVDSVLSGRVPFPANRWGRCGEDIKDLLRGMLQIDPALRLTADEIRAHPWMNPGVDRQRLSQQSAAAAAAAGGGGAGSSRMVASQATQESKDAGARGRRRMPSNVMTISSYVDEADEDEADISAGAAAAAAAAAGAGLPGPGDEDIAAAAGPGDVDGAAAGGAAKKPAGGSAGQKRKTRGGAAVADDAAAPKRHHG